jgi:hypothetical protein
MGFDYRELANQIPSNGPESEAAKLGCEQCSTTKPHREDDTALRNPLGLAALHRQLAVACCVTCGPTTKVDSPPEWSEHGEHRKTLAVLRQQLRDALAAG